MNYPFITVSNCGCSPVTPNTNSNDCTTNKTLASNVVYNGPELTCTTVEPCDTLNTVLQKIDQAVCGISPNFITTLTAGTNIVIDTSSPQSASNPKISVTGIPPTIVTSVVGSANITVNNANPAAPIITATGLATVAQAKEESIVIPISDLITNITVGTNKAFFTMPFDFTLQATRPIFLDLLFPQSAGANLLTIDIFKNGVSILVNKLVINNSAFNSKLSAAPTFVSGGDSFVEGDRLTFDVLLIGTPGAKGGLVTIKGTRT
jgi:hypothetical protein